LHYQPFKKKKKIFAILNGKVIILLPMPWQIRQYDTFMMRPG
jgi:hypothetical protein